MIFSSLAALSSNLVKPFCSVAGWLVIVASGVVSFFSPEKYCFALVALAIVFDAAWGVSVSVHKGGFALSKLGRVTVFKFSSYATALIFCFCVEKLAHDGGFIGIKVATAWACACEFWSASASMLIIRPNMPFLRLFRRALKGEIEAKLGKNISDILPEDTQSPDSEQVNN